MRDQQGPGHRADLRGTTEQRREHDAQQGPRRESAEHRDQTHPPQRPTTELAPPLEQVLAQHERVLGRVEHVDEVADVAGLARVAGHHQVPAVVHVDRPEHHPPRGDQHHDCVGSAGTRYRQAPHRLPPAPAAPREHQQRDQACGVRQQERDLPGGGRGFIARVGVQHNLEAVDRAAGGQLGDLRRQQIRAVHQQRAVPEDADAGGVGQHSVVALRAQGIGEDFLTVDQETSLPCPRGHLQAGGVRGVGAQGRCRARAERFARDRGVEVQRPIRRQRQHRRWRRIAGPRPGDHGRIGLHRSKHREQPQQDRQSG